MVTRASRKVLRRRVRRQRQLTLALKRDKNDQLRGGKRPGAGRKPRVLGRPSSPHKRRPEVDPKKPQHVTLRVMGDVGHLRKPHMFRAIRAALVVVAEHADEFRIVHFSVQGNHLHLICEAKDRMALAHGMKSFQISAAKHLNDEVSRERGTRRNGQVFADRYHVKAIGSIRQTRNVLSYVLNNWRHHPHSNRGPALFDGRLDPYSSAVFFAGWKERTVPLYVPEDYEAPSVCRPTTWLLAESWKRAKPISVWEVPGVPT